MAVDTTRPQTRRALLATAVGGVAAAAAASIVRASPVEGANGDTMKVGEDHVGTSRTTITKTTPGGAAFKAASNVGGTGLVGMGEDGNGVVGQSSGGYGVLAASGATGIRGEGELTAIEASSPGGLGLRIQKGRIQIEQVSGVATIKKGTKSKTVNPGVDINARTFVLLTPMANIGSRALWFTKSPSTNKFTIRMSSTRGGPTKVAWLALERG